jgi:predicted DNA-binding transcriptional regulator AlpA
MKTTTETPAASTAAAALAVAMADLAAGVPLPAYVRAPKKGERCKVTGLSRSFIYQLINSGAVDSVAVPTPGKQGRGARLISTASLIRWVESHRAK